MADNETPRLDDVEILEIEALSDEALEDVAGGVAPVDGSSSCCSCDLCSG